MAKPEPTAPMAAPAVRNIPSTCVQAHAPITYFSLSPGIFRLAAVIYRNDRPLTKAENRLIQLAKQYPLCTAS